MVCRVMHFSFGLHLIFSLMNGLDIRNKNYTAQLADDFNRFYLSITDRSLDQIGNYKIVEEIGEGSFGKVYLAHHVLLNLPVVLKSGLIDDPNIVREIYYHKQLKHKNIVKLYEVIKTETTLWLVMEYCQGNELYYYIYENRRLEVKKVQNLFFQIIQAIRYVHLLNLAHRDLKLENILLADKKRTIIKLTDFGFVREFNPARRKLLSTMCGTTVYMAPEVLKNEKYSGFAADIWSLGVILYTMLHGQMPFDEDDELKTKYKIIHEDPRYHDSVPASAVALTKRLLNKDPTGRPNLNEILNSEFLIDITNKFPTERKRLLENESVMSINQYYNSGLPPFQSKTVKVLLKRLEKSGVRVDKLKKDVENGEMNTLTAFYDLSLTREFIKKKKRRRSARSSLKKSRNKVKSVLLLSEEGGSQPLERIMSSLSISSRSQSKTNLAAAAAAASALGRRSTDRKSGDRRRSTDTLGFPASDLTAVDSTPPLNRTVSFYPQNETDRRTSLSSAISSIGDKRKRNTDINPNGQSRKLMSRFQFWKKKDDPDTLPIDMSSLRDHTDTSMNSSSPQTVYESNVPNVDIHFKKPKALEPGHHIISDAPSPKTLRPAAIDGKSSPSTKAETPQSVKLKTRPSSMVSQISQISQISQLSTMMSELESEMLASDSMDEFEEEDLYESSSMNTSTIEIGRNSSSKATRGKRPSYRRQVSSDVLIASASTSAMSRHPSVQKRASSLRQVSSNSSEESSDILLPVATGTHNNLVVPEAVSKTPVTFVFGRTSSPVNNPPRSASPPMPTQATKFRNLPGVDKSSGIYRTRNPIINEEENEDENSL